MKHALSLLAAWTLVLAAPSIGLAESKMKIIDMKTAEGIDEAYMPLNAARTFPAGTSKVFCWFQWENGDTGSQVALHWHYISEKVAILEYPVPVPRREGSGGVSLSMPEGETLPAGTYEVSVRQGGKVLKSERFQIG